MPRLGVPVALALVWSVFCAWCVSGFPPCIDLPAHAAQMQVLGEVLRGGPASAVFEAHLSPGYGLSTWLFVPVAMCFDGAVAAKGAAWLALAAFPLTVGLLAKGLGRPAGLAVLAAPLGFSVSYWYGFLPTLVAGPLVVLTWALWLAQLEQPTTRRAVGLLGLSLLVLLCHFIAWGALVVGAIALTAGHRPLRWRALGVVVAPLLVALPRIVELVTSAASGGAALSTRYNLDAHLLGVVKQYPLGARISFWLNAGALALIGGSAAVRWWRSRSAEPAVLLAVSQLGLFVVTPDDLAGSWRVGVRLVVFGAVATLCAYPFDRVPRVLFAVPLVALACLAHLHVWFAHEVAGLGAVIVQPPPPGVHGGLLLTGAAPPHTRLALLEHQPQWWTARWGGVGTHFFADATHQPVQWRRDVPVTQALKASTLEPASLDAVLVYGEGDLPPALTGLRVVQTAGRWRRLERW